LVFAKRPAQAINPIPEIMKRTIPKRSAEELQKFFKKSSNKAVIENLNETKKEKKPVSLHQIIENAVLKLENPVPLTIHKEEEDFALDLDDNPMDFEEEE